MGLGGDFSKLSQGFLKAATSFPHINNSHPFSQPLENAS